MKQFSQWVKTGTRIGKLKLNFEKIFSTKDRFYTKSFSRSNKWE